MSRYTITYAVPVSLEELHKLLQAIFQSCELELIYQTVEYIMVREKLGTVNFAQLVTVEAIIDAVSATEDEIYVTLVAKNDQLPIHNNNRCQQKLNQLKEIIEGNYGWRSPLNSVN